MTSMIQSRNNRFGNDAYLDYDTQDEAQGGQPDILGLVADWKSTAGSDSLPPLWGSSPKDVNRK